MSKRFDMLYAEADRPSIPPERLRRALLLHPDRSVGMAEELPTEGWRRWGWRTATASSAAMTGTDREPIAMPCCTANRAAGKPVADGTAEADALCSWSLRCAGSCPAAGSRWQRITAYDQRELVQTLRELGSPLT